MNEEALTRLEAMLVSLRDQLDRLTERVDGRLADQQLLLSRLRLDLARLEAPRPQVAAPPAPDVMVARRP
jgi:hypothetical protein